MKTKTIKVVSFLVAFMLVISTALFSFGCKAETAKTDTASETTIAQTTTAAETTASVTTEEDFAVQYPITIEDDKGQQEGFENRKLVIKEEIKSVIAGENNFAICLKEFGKLDAVKGIAYWVPEAVPELADSPQIITSGGLDLEALIDISPELMVTISEPYWEPAIVKQVEDAGIMIYSIGIVKSLDHIKKYINDYGKMFDSMKIANMIISEMEEKQKKVEEAVKNKGLKDEEKPKVIYCMSIASEYGDWVPGANTFVDQLITDAGGINIPASQGIDGWAEYSVEKLLESDPDVIIVPVGKNPGHGFKSIEEFTKHEAVQNLKAVKNGKVFAVTAEYVNNLSFTTADALIEFAQAILGVKIE